MNVVRWCDRIIRFSFYILVFLVPLILTPWNYELFEFNKMMLTYGLTVVIVTAWVTKTIYTKTLIWIKTPLMLPILLFVFFQLVSAVFSIDPHISWFGYYSRFNGGMFSILSYTALYFVFINTIYKETQTNKEKFLRFDFAYIRHLVYVMLLSAGIVATYGALERMGIDKHLWVQDVQSRVFSTLGQPNWLAAYLASVMPLVSALALSCVFVDKKQKKQIVQPIFLFWCVLAILFCFVIINTRSRSGLFGMGIGMMIFGLGTLLNASIRKLVLLPWGIIISVLALLVFFHGTFYEPLDSWVTLKGLQQRITSNTKALTPKTSPDTPQSGTMLEYGGTESGIIRKYVWQGALNAWESTAKTILVGTGTDTFAWAFFRFRPKEHNMVSEWDFLYNKAHNEYLNYLATTGILGFGSYMVFLGVCIFVCVKRIVPAILSYKDTSAELEVEKEHLLALALFSGWITLLITNFFGFSVVITQMFLFLFPALLFVFPYFPNTVMKKSLGIPDSINGFLYVGCWIVAGYTIITLLIGWYADTLYASGYRYNRSGQPLAAQPILVQATALVGNEPLYHDELSSSLASLAVIAVDNKQASEAAQLAQLALNESDAAIRISPQNVNLWKTRTKIFYQLSPYDPKLIDEAIKALTVASELSPNDPKILYNLAILYARKGVNDKAVSILLQAKDLKPNYRDLYYALSVFYTDMKKPKESKAILKEYLTKVDPQDKEFLEKTK